MQTGKERRIQLKLLHEIILGMEKYKKKKNLLVTPLGNEENSREIHEVFWKKKFGKEGKSHKRGGSGKRYA